MRYVIPSLLEAILFLGCTKKSSPVTGGISGVVSAGPLMARQLAKTDKQGVTGPQAHGLFVAQYDTTGALQWITKDGAIDLDHFIQLAGLVIDSAGNIFVAGSTNDILDGQGLRDIPGSFIMKFGNDGTRDWTLVDPTIPSPNIQRQDFLGGVAIDASGNVYLNGVVTGAYDGQVVNGEAGMFLGKYGVSQF